MTARARAALAFALLLAAPRPGAAAPPAFERTEERAPCADYAPLRKVHFGDLHVHTAFSYDASALGVRNTPRDAYRFARGEMLGMQPYDDLGNPLRRVQLRRPLDFAAVTDHAELLGEVRLCGTPGAAYGSFMCTLNRRWPLLAYLIVNSAMLNVANPTRFSFCGPDGALCRAAALGPWAETQQAAEEAYDRTAACRFTSFVAYEWSGNPFGNMTHRNVVFRNHVVQERPSSYIDHRTGAALWERLYAECLDRANGCDVITIPHNSNLSGGLLFPIEDEAGNPIDAGRARRSAGIERLIEIVQHKGTSECRVGGPFAEDELCGFEQLPFARMDQYPFESWWTEPPARVYTREILGEGLAQGARLGVNPFKLGIIGSTDTHLGTAGLADEDLFPGHGAGGDTTRSEIPFVPDRLFSNPGGLAAVWAEENSRDALFAAMRRRETYGTSGPRLTVRFFGGWSYPDDLCVGGDVAAAGYAGGVPMGGDLPPGPSGDAPRLVVQATADPGDGARPPIPLGRVQIVKIWLEEGGPREQVFDVAGAPMTDAGVDPATCELRGSGPPTLCAVWRDPAFDPAAAALYYARVLEVPTCRWSNHTCVAHGVSCATPGDVPDALAYCCHPGIPKTIQERAWTSPVWYTPAAAAGTVDAAGGRVMVSGHDG